MEDYGNEGLGLAEAAGLVPDQDLTKYDFFDAFWHYFQNDLISSIPISICSVLVLLVIIERALFYNKNYRNIYSFIQRLQHQLEKGELENALLLCGQLGSVVGDVAEEGVRLLAVQKEDFAKAYDVTVNIETRKLEKYLPILGTVGAIAPFLGLFGTVSGVIKALYKMAQGSEGASLTMIGEISNALIATGYGLAIAIIAVVSNNLFNNIVKRFEDDFMLLKLLFLSFSGIDFNQLKREAVINRMDQEQAAKEEQAREPASTTAGLSDPGFGAQNPGQGEFGNPGFGENKDNPPNYPDFLS